MLKSRNTVFEWVQIIAASLFVMYLGYFFSLRTEDHIINATQSTLKRPCSYVYLKYILNVNSDTRVGDRTPIQYALMNYGDLNAKKKKRLEPLIDMFIEKGVDINAHSTYGLTSLHYAIMSEDPIAVQLLLEKKAIVNNPVRIENIDQMVKPVLIVGMTPLGFLEERKKEKLVRDEGKVAIIEALLKEAGGYVKAPELLAAEQKAKAAPVKKSKKKK
jgi:hypothetical protein